MIPQDFERILTETIFEKGGQILDNFDLCGAILKDKAEGRDTALIRRFIEALKLLVHQRIKSAGDIEFAARQQIELLKSNYFPEDLAFDFVSLLCKLLRNYTLQPTQKPVPPQININITPRRPNNNTKRIIRKADFVHKGVEYTARTYKQQGKTSGGEVVFRGTDNRPANMKGIVREYLAPYKINISTDPTKETTHSAVRKLIKFLATK